jgi:hypothetical protein
MLTRFKLRRLMAVLGVAAVTHTAGLLAAQPVVPSTTNRTPRLLSSCDVTIQSCGGDPILGGGGTSGGYGPPSVACGGGYKTICYSQTVKTCTSYIIVSGDGKIEFSPTQVQIGGHLSGECAEYYETTVTTYKI